MTTDSMQSDRAGTSHDYKFHAPNQGGVAL